MKIQITANDISFQAELFETPTGKAIAGALPISGQVNRWGGEIYFAIPVAQSLEPDSRDVLAPGELGFWPTGNAFCIFFGATPASQNDECRAASAVNVFGKVNSDLDELWDVPDGAAITIEAATE
ncbi:MAG: cyclophilin-like fold protein [Planctomycetota bacterium]|jgi:hypothetical protein